MVTPEGIRVKVGWSHRFPYSLVDRCGVNSSVSLIATAKTFFDTQLFHSCKEAPLQGDAFVSQSQASPVCEEVSRDC
jgi:hypothetical protein